MQAYIIAAINIEDPEQFDTYQMARHNFSKKYKDKFIVQKGSIGAFPIRVKLLLKEMFSLKYYE